MHSHSRLCIVAILFLASAQQLASAQSNQEWTEFKKNCNLPANLAYNDWLQNGPPCKSTNAANGGTAVLAAPAGATLQQKMALTAAQAAMPYLQQAVHNFFYGSPTTQPVVDPAEQQRTLAAQQLNDSGIYLFKQRNYASAINEFQQALARTPNDANIINNLALAKQQLNIQQLNLKAATQTSDVLRQVLGDAPANTGKIDFDQLTHSSVASPNASPLNLVRLGSDAEVVDLRGATRTFVDPESLKGQLDGILTNHAPASAPPEPQVVPPQAQEIELMFQPPQSTPSPSQMNAEQQQLEDIFRGPGGTTDSTALAQQARLGQMAAAATSDEDASALARQGFDAGAANVVVTQTRTIQAPAPAVPASIPSAAVDLSQSTEPPVPESLKTPQVAPNAAPELAKFPITIMKSAGSDGFAAPGAPIFDCKGDRAIIPRLAAGLPAQEEAIRRTAAAMVAAKADGDEPRRQAMFAAVSTLLASATTVSNWAEAVIAKVEGLKSAGITPKTAAQFKFLEKMKKILDVSNTLIGLAANARKSYDAGYAFGDAVLVQETAKTLVEQLKAAGKLLVDSELASQAGEDAAAKLAAYGFGPVVGALVQTLTSAFEVYLNGQRAWNSAGEAEQAERDLTVMRDQQMLARDRIYELQQEVAVGCSNRKVGDQ